LLAASAVLGAALGAAHAFAVDPIDALARTVESDPNDKARIAAVVALGGRADPRALAPLILGLSDVSPVVRGLAATALGHKGDARAVPALERALSDGDDGVRARVREALAQLRPSGPAAPAAEASPPPPTRARITPREAPLRGRLHVLVHNMGVRSPAARHLSEHMRERVIAELAAAPDITVDGSGDDAHQFILDGSITKLARETRGPWLEVTCEVKITVSNGRGSILSIVSGGATVQAERRRLARGAEPGMQVEALDNAVKGAHQNLYAFIARQGGAR
jgi:hypothetical protein